MTHAPSTNLIDHPGKLLRMALGLASSGDRARALALVEQVLASRPDDPALQAVAAQVLRHKVPRFHRSMLADAPRNTFYRQAIEQAVSGKLVLDIGTGSGLLAMMAARAGARKVVACEGDPILAETARRIVAANGLDHVIEVHAAKSTELDRERDLDGGAEVVVSEIFSSNVVGEGVLGSLEHARQNLTVPGAMFLPPRAEAIVALVDAGADAERLDDIEGFDLSPFAAHMPPRLPEGMRLRDLPLVSEPASLFSLDLSGDVPIAPSGGGAARLVASGPRATGVLQWLRLHAEGPHPYENHPATLAEGRHWAPVYTPLPHPLALSPGEAVEVRYAFEGAQLLVWCA